MDKSFIERLFPHSSQSLLPRYSDESRQTQLQHSLDQSLVSEGASRIYDHATTTSRSQSVRWRPPLSASLIHHDDPFLPIERAARALQATIQSLLDIQAAALSNRSSGQQQEDEASNGSLTPTQSALSSQRYGSPRKTLPIRQPIRPKVSLRSARRGITKSMRDFVSLRNEELRLLESESKARKHALEKIEGFQGRKNALQTEIEAISQDESSEKAATFRSEAKTVALDIQELEHRLLELRVRHRHLLAQAEEVESTQDSRASSYRNALKIVEKETNEFLKRPSVTHAFSEKSLSENMYSLNPKRRTLQMAREQWTSELAEIWQRTKQVEQERNALRDGEQIWSDSLQSITSFEQRLRAHTKELAQSLTDVSDSNRSISHDIAGELSQIVVNLEKRISQAEAQGWNLLICALGAELQSCAEAQNMLQQNEQGSDNGGEQDLLDGSSKDPFIDPDASATKHWATAGRAVSPITSERSNQSLKDTLAEFQDETPVPPLNLAHDSTTLEQRYESEDDEPPADFLLSR